MERVFGWQRGKTRAPIEGLSICWGIFVLGSAQATQAIFIPVPPMTEVSRIADSTTFKVAVPILQTILSAGAIGAFVYVVGSLGSLQVQLAAYQTSQALIGQRVDSLERSRESTDKFVDSLRTSTQRQEFQINQLGEGLKGLAQMGRPK